ncbi:SBDS family rRNA metabolism protein, variant [Aphanomyces astaci]|uniref:SBDS family rRNA metabolism protein, variant n=1 Tax=Aphanomyces astaci TaxID=112090 RepID=W4GRA0_APHAT|nr:SBDS family rRNA metabolism protein, variant [Aphanomyces astaci]ETV81534.1 SBDS family rRNA metabolism protein, variant [Aphanomyces astaci]|eukprot:XP_009829392.1 SBDS family rRNA metabolism protein, variant [Aphanomyces astaci]
MGYLHQSQRVFTPLSQARLEHIDVVRLKKGGCRFEVACFKNKLVEWRRGIETNLSDVLQSEAIFDNVSRGKRARDEDIQRVFGTQDIVEVATFIMTKGAIHVSESIRVAEHDSMFQEVGSVIAKTSVNPEISRPYPMSAIEQMMQKIHVALTPHEPVDIQALGVLQQLKQVMPIVRATMKVHVSVASTDVRHMQSTLQSLGATVFEQHSGANGALECTCLIEPGVFGAVKAFVSEHATRNPHYPSSLLGNLKLMMCML